MKKLIFLLFVMFLTSALFAQEKSNYEKYCEARDAEEARIQDSITKSKQSVEKPVVKKNKPHTIFDKVEPQESTIVYVNTNDDVDVYLVDPFDYSIFFTPFAFSVSFGYPYYGYPYYGYPYWGYYDYYWGWGYPYYGYPYYGYGYPYYGYGYPYYPHNGDRGHGALGWHGYSSGYHTDISRSVNTKTYVNSYPMTRRSSSTSNMGYKSKPQENFRTYSGNNKSTYKESGRSTPTYSEPRMSTRPQYNNSKSNRNTFNSYQRTNTQTSRSYSTPSSKPNSFGSQQRARTSTQGNRSYSTPRNSPSSSKSYSAPSRSYSSPSHSSGSFGGSSSSRSSGSYSGGHGKR